MKIRTLFANQKQRIIIWYEYIFGITTIMISDISQALKQANVSDPSKCYFIDDSLNNISGARAVGWAKCVHFCEQGLETTEGGRKIEIERNEAVNQLTGVDTVTNLEGLRSVWPEIFKK
jgi:pyrimidine and pyridine-specific 5'-nucleotidase